jgi:hypothetical protein
MKIIQPKIGFLDNKRLRQDLLQLIAQPSTADSPPCPGCKRHMPTLCSSQCAQAPTSLSIEPVNYPIEFKVVSLVFELTATRLIQPGWSCEGHLDPDGKLWKIPQVSFYSASPIYPQLLLKYIHSLELEKHLAYRWHVVLTDFGQTWETTYTLEPNLNWDHNVHFGKLQGDLNTLADNLCNRLKAFAQSTLNSLRPNPA